jgi:hypothetical protein
VLSLANPWFILGSLAAAVVLSGACYVKGRSDGRAIEIAERATLEEVAKVAREAAMAGAAKKIAEITINHTTIRQKAEVITRENVVYRDCRNSAELVGLLDDARANREPAEPANSGELPGTGANPAPDVR